VLYVLGFPTYSDVATGCHPRFCFDFDILNANPAVAKLAAVQALTVLLSRMSPMGFVAGVAGVAVVAVLPQVSLWRFSHGAALIHSVSLQCRCFHPWVVSIVAHRWCRRVCVESRLVPSRSGRIIHAKIYQCNTIMSEENVQKCDQQSLRFLYNTPALYSAHLQLLSLRYRYTGERKLLPNLIQSFRSSSNRQSERKVTFFSFLSIYTLQQVCVIALYYKNKRKFTQK